MTNQKAIEILTAKAECVRRETSGIDIDCKYRNCDECDLCYKQGTTGDQRKALSVAISALQAREEPKPPASGSVTCMFAKKMHDRPTQPEPCLDSIVSEIKKTISETQENGKYHCVDIRINGEIICFGLQLALEIIEEKRNGQYDN